VLPELLGVNPFNTDVKHWDICELDNIIKPFPARPCVANRVSSEALAVAQGYAGGARLGVSLLVRL